MKKILVLHGPNLNLLGTREQSIYGTRSLEEINDQIIKASKNQVTCFQSNAEHELINRVHAALAEKVDFIIINPAAFSHTSLALSEALLAVNIPYIEVHISNVYAREPFRHHSYFTGKAIGVIAGLGIDSYLFALQFADKYLK